MRNRVLVLNEQNRGRVWHRSALPARRARPTIATAWRRSRPVPRGDARAEGRSSGRSTGASTAAPGCSSACRCSIARVQRRAARPAAAAAIAARRRSTARARVALAADLATALPGPRAGQRRRRRSGAVGSRPAAPVRAARSQPERFRADGARARRTYAREPGRDRRRGRSPDAIVVLAHRDDDGAGPGANDNASGTAALIQLARSYCATAGAQRDQRRSTRSSSCPPTAARSAASARERFAETPPGARSSRRSTSTRSRANGPPRAGAHRRRAAPRRRRDSSRRPRSACSSRQAGARRIPARSRQLVDLGFPFTLLRAGAARWRTAFRR